MNRKLEEIYQRYEKLGELLADQATLSDMSLWQKYAKERSDIEETANKYAEYKNAETESATLESELKTESDKEMKDLLESELEDCKKRLSAIKGELKILLLPKNPDDDKNVIVEIRSGAGGEEAALCRQKQVENGRNRHKRNRTRRHKRGCFFDKRKGRVQ